jgi:sigma-B regulation protein RsbU (phosphoserine phosphatase)
MNRMQQLRKLTQVSHALTNAASLDELFRLAVVCAAELLAAEKAVLLVAGAADVLELRASHGIDPGLALRLAEHYREPLNETLVPRLAGLLDARPDRFLGVPLVVTGEIKGLLVVIRRNPGHDVDHDEWLLSVLADQAAVALETTRLTETGEFREQLIGIVGHDLRNPLTTITLGAQILLLREGLGESETAVARKIASSAAQATRLIDQLLDLTRSRLGGGIPIDPAPMDLERTCREVVGEMTLSHPDRPIAVEVRGDVTGVWDRDRLYQVIGNLVGNAIQHGEPRSPIELRLEGDEAEVTVEVSNRGEPIPAAMLPAIFEAFRKKRTRHPSRSSGLGLGLFIAQQVARAHGGSIAVGSSENQLTTFRVRLPRGVRPPPPA